MLSGIEIFTFLASDHLNKRWANYLQKVNLNGFACLRRNSLMVHAINISILGRHKLHLRKSKCCCSVRVCKAVRDSSTTSFFKRHHDCTYTEKVLLLQLIKLCGYKKR